MAYEPRQLIRRSPVAVATLAEGRSIFLLQSNLLHFYSIRFQTLAQVGYWQDLYFQSVVQQPG